MLKESRDLSAKGAKEDIDGYDSDPETHTYSRGIGPGSRKNLTRPSNSYNPLYLFLLIFPLFYRKRYE